MGHLRRTRSLCLVEVAAVLEDLRVLEEEAGVGLEDHWHYLEEVVVGAEQEVH